ncbi:ABC transporter substrate-binding protein [Acidisphaera sp. L21]|uniref:ABC transporter substrate-binding protein n=1 Tax=Acidisphaera sp. L21 TaxID=1641851 RepID=UPI00131C5A62|nr:ABC transporter substrate-binding protein [Acidisphaera sp. L21]
MMHRRTALATLAAAALPRFAVAQADTRPALTIAVQKIANTGTLEPLREQSSNASEHYLAGLLETPIARNQQAGLARMPGLATAWRRIDDRTVELDLRPCVRFHDGTTMTAEDVAWNFGPERMFGSALPADIPAIARRHWPALERVDATGPLTVRFVNAKPDITMEGRLSAGGSEIVSPRSFHTPWVDYARAPSGTGPYKLREFRPDVSLTLDAHDDYWGGRPPCRSIRFLEVPEAAARVNGLLSGQYDLACDIVPDQIDAIEGTGRFVVRGGPVTNHRIVNFDMHHPSLADPRVRLAMAQAVDGKAIVDSLWAGRTTIPPGLQFAFYGPMLVPGWTVPPNDPAAARALLKAAGYKGDPIPYRIRKDYYAAETSTAQVLAAMWQDVGLNVELSIKENWSQVLEKTPPRGLRNWSNSAVFDDPVSSIVNQEGPNGAQQQVGEWSNAEMNTLSGQMEASSDIPARRAMFARMLQICEREDPAYIVLHQNANFTAVRKTLAWPGTASFYVDLSPRGLPG